MSNYTFNFSRTNDEAAILVGVLAGLGAFSQLHYDPLSAIYTGVLAGAAILGYTGVTPATAPAAGAAPPA